MAKKSKKSIQPTIKKYLSRYWGFVKYWRDSKECKRCGGTGLHSHNAYDGSKCYGCNGVGLVRTKRADRELDYFEYLGRLTNSTKEERRKAAIDFGKAFNRTTGQPLKKIPDWVKQYLERQVIACLKNNQTVPNIAAELNLGLEFVAEIAQVYELKKAAAGKARTTKGPWLATETLGDGWHIVIKNENGTQYTIAKFDTRLREDSKKGAFADESNAKLAAAAPEMLETLKTLVEYLDSIGGFTEAELDYTGLNDAKELIKKLGGE